jgi:saxitoxin biosynthesis operon SxtJ-like protein
VSDRTKELRSFGLLVGAVFALIATVSYWSGRGIRVWPLFAAGLLIVPAILKPRILAPVHRVWMQLAQLLAWINTRLILILAYFIMLTPVGIIRRWLGADALGLRFDRGAGSYRTTRSPRPSSHMTHQF